MLVFQAVRACFLEAQNNSDLPIVAQNNSDLQNNNDLPIVVQPSEARNNDNNLPVPIEPIEEKNENQILYRKYVKVLLSWKDRLNLIIIFTQHF